MASQAKQVDVDSAEEVRQPRVTFSRRLLRLVLWSPAWGLVLLLIVFGLSNCWLWSSWGTGMVEERLRRMTGQEWEIDRISWSPWNGVSLYGVEMFVAQEADGQPEEAIISVERVRVYPYWRKLAAGKLYPQGIEIESPKFYVTLEMLAGVLSHNAARQNQEPVPRLLEKKPVRKLTAEPEEHEVEPQSIVSRSSESASRVEHQKREQPRLPVHLKITNAQLRFGSFSKPLSVFSCEGLDYEHVLFGGDSEGEIFVRHMQFFDFAALNDVSRKVLWKRPVLTFEEVMKGPGGVEVKCVAQWAFLKGRSKSLPFLLDVSMKPQKVEPISILGRNDIVVGVEHMGARMRVNGLLNHPITWRVDGLLKAQNGLVSDRYGKYHVLFTEVDAPVILRRGVLRWDRVRLMSEDVAVMSNGRVSARDGHLSVIRVVASPEIARALTRVMYGVGITQLGEQWWYDLGTPDRKVRDLVISGPLLLPEVDAGSDHRAVTLTQMFQMFLHFLRKEVDEERYKVESLPDIETQKREPSQS